MSGANVDLEPEPATAELVGECDISRVEAPGASQSGHEIDDDLEQLGATAVDAATLEHRVIQNASKRKAGDSVSEDTRQGADARKERLSQQLKAAQEELNTVKAVLDADPEEAAPDEKPPKAASRPLGARSTRFRGGSSAKRKKQREELPVLDDEEEGALPGSKEQEDGTKAVDLTGDLQRALMEERAAALQRKVKHLQEAVRQLEAGGRRLQLQEADLFEEEADNSRPGLLETDRDRLIRTGVITPFAQVKGYEKRVQQRSRPAAVPDGPHAESIARVAQRIKEAAENRPRTVLVDASQVPKTECDVPRMDPGFWRRHTHSAAPPPKRPKRQQTLPRAKRKAEAGGVSGADAEGGGEESGDEQGRASEAVQDLVAEMEDAEGEYDDAEDDFYEQRVAVAEERRLLEQEAADGEGGDTPGPSGSAAGGGGEDVEFDGGLRVPAQLFDQLFAYQKTGVKWLWELYTQRAGGIIADEMGLGKTAQVVAFLAGLHRSGMYRPSLVVCPATVLRQWMREVRRWYPPFRCIILHDAGRSPSGLRPGKEELVRTALSSDAGLLVTTYDQLRLQKALLLGIEWGCAVLDEGHKIRNPDADITLTCKQLATVHRYIMTGSPIQNRLTELWSLFDYVFPGKLGTLPVFQTEFSIPIQVGGYVNASRVQVTTAYRCALVLRDVIAPYLLRRIKADVQAQLPNKTEQVLFCKLTAHQRTLYRQYLASSEVSEILAGSRNALMGIDTLRKICNHPDLLERDTAEGSDTYGDPSRCGKLQVFLKVLRLWCSQGHKVLVFTQTQQMLDILQRHVHTEGLTWHRMDGSTSVRQRSRLIDDFNTSARVQVFLLTTRVGGLGVNLTGASRVVLYDPDWNPSTDMQARERAWRIGQKRDVTIYRLITSGTIEEKVYHRQVFKQFLTNRILRDPRQKRFFSSKGMADLFTLGLEEDESGASETASIFRSIQGEVLPPGSPAAEREPAAVGPDSAAADSTSAPATPPEQASSPGGGATPPQQRGRGRRRRSDEAGAMEEEEEAEEEEEEGRGGGQEEESRILQELFSATGITSALDHSKIESANDPEVLREDARAAAVASQAAEALRRSRRECQANGVHVPTWTGRSGEAGAPSLFNRRFGVTRNPALPEPRPAASTSPPAAGSSAAPSRPAAGLVPGAGAALSSQDLLARIQARRQGRATASSTSSAAPPSGASNTPCPEVESAQQMMTMIIDFLTQHGGRARSAHLIQHFDGVVPQQQLPVFRHVLKQVAVLNRRNGQGWWQLKPQHSRASAPETT